MEIIAEIGQNHNGDMDLARRLIWQAKENGAEVAKFQVYDARRLFPRENNPWFDYNCSTELSREQVKLLDKECRAAGVEFMASVFDTERVLWLEDLGVRRYKLASRSVEDRPLIEALCATGKPLIVSLGMWQGPGFPDIPSPKPVAFLYCISRYPTPLEDLHLKKVDFKRYHGFSDHTEGVNASLAALALGARIIEKHFTLDKAMFGPDHACSITPAEMAQIHTFRRDLEKAL